MDNEQKSFEPVNETANFLMKYGFVIALFVMYCLWHLGVG